MIYCSEGSCASGAWITFLFFNFFVPSCVVSSLFFMAVPKMFKEKKSWIFERIDESWSLDGKGISRHSFTNWVCFLPLAMRCQVRSKWIDGIGWKSVEIVFPQKRVLKRSKTLGWRCCFSNIFSIALWKTGKPTPFHMLSVPTISLYLFFMKKEKLSELARN